MGGEDDAGTVCEGRELTQTQESGGRCASYARGWGWGPERCGVVYGVRWLPSNVASRRL